jgi:uncharacterized SAM-binding protein YcdF (DUF218 family)
LIYLHKILPIFFLPTVATLLLVTAGLLLRKRALCWAGVALLWLCSLPPVGDAAMRAAEGWQERQPVSAAPAAHAIVVLSGGRAVPPGDPAVVEWTEAVDRFDVGVQLYQAGKAPWLILTGGWLPWRPDMLPEGEVLAGLAAERGVPAADIRVTGKASNTAEEAAAVAAVLAELPPPPGDAPILLVTSAYHMRRAQLIFEQAGMAVVPFPVDFQSSAGAPFSILDLLPGAESLRRTEMALREAYGYWFYWLKGRGGFTPP